MQSFEETMRRGGGAAIAEASRFYMNEGSVHRTLHKIATHLSDMGIPYAVVGGMALNAHGYVRATVDVDILVDGDGLASIHQRLEGLGYVPPFAGSKHLRDTETSVRIEFLVTGQFPGDGKPKPVAFPAPADVSIELDGVNYLKLPTLIELKLASGMTNPRRMKDLADVQELIHVLKLPADLSEQMNEFVRDKYRELWEIASQPDPHDES